MENQDNRRTLEFELVRRVQSGDEEAFRQIVERHQNRIFSVVYRTLRNREDAEDVAQRVFTKVYFAIQSFDCRNSFLTWIYKIAINECYSHLRKRRIALAHLTTGRAVDGALQPAPEAGVAGGDQTDDPVWGEDHDQDQNRPI